MSDEKIPTPFEAAKARIIQIRGLVTDGVLVEGEDFGVIPGKGNKPTLLKPGAQKIMALFGLASEVRNVKCEGDGSFVKYIVTVTLRCKSTGGIESEGVGSCDSRERKYARQNAADIDNTLLKMAKKRAMIDGVLDATGASGMFTQDIEDMDWGGNGSTPAPPPEPQASEAQLKRYAEIRKAAIDAGYLTPKGAEPKVLEAGATARECEVRGKKLMEWLDDKSAQEKAEREAAESAEDAAARDTKGETASDADAKQEAVTA